MKTRNFLFLHPFPPVRNEFAFAKQAHLGLHYGLGVLAQMVKNRGHNIEVLAFSDLERLDKSIKRPYDWVFMTTFTINCR